LSSRQDRQAGAARAHIRCARAYWPSWNDVAALKRRAWPWAHILPAKASRLEGIMKHNSSQPHREARLRHYAEFGFILQDWRPPSRARDVRRSETKITEDALVHVPPPVPRLLCCQGAPIGGRHRRRLPGPPAGARLRRVAGDQKGSAWRGRAWSGFPLTIVNKERT
jgi:hypothetical protein